MKKKIGGLVFLLTIFAFVLVPLNANADISQGFHTVNVKCIGPLFGKTIVLVDAVDGSFTDQWLEIDPTNQNPLLATILTAVSLNKPVRVWILSGTYDLVGLTVQTCYSVLLETSD